MKRLKLEDIVNELELISDEGNSFLNKITGELFHISYKEFEHNKSNLDCNTFIREWLAEKSLDPSEIFRNDNYIQLPTRNEINEYGIMMKFLLDISDERIHNEVYNSMNGNNGGSTALIDIMTKYNAGDDWYKYKREAFRQIAINWCKRNINKIPFDTQQEVKRILTTIISSS